MKSRVTTFIIGFIVPMTAILVLFPFYNRIEPFVFGFSFNYFWVFSWLFLTSLCLYIAFRIDPYNNEAGRAAGEKNMKDAKALLESIEKGGAE